MAVKDVNRFDKCAARCARLTFPSEKRVISCKTPTEINKTGAIAKLQGKETRFKYEKTFRDNLDNS